MASWNEFVERASDVAGTARRLLYQYGIGLGYLATVRPDGGPRIHPISPIISEAGLHAFLIPSPKRDDLDADGRYALHAYAPADVDDECLITGTAVRVDDDAIRAIVAAAYHDDPRPDDVLYELGVDRCTVATYERRGQWPPTYATWRDR